jgi:hypothetical protein
VVAPGCNNKKSKKKLEYSDNISESLKQKKRKKIIENIEKNLNEEVQNKEEQEKLLGDSLTKTRFGKNNFTIFKEKNFYQKIGENVVNIMNNFGQNEKLRKILISNFFSGISYKEIEENVNYCSSKTIQRAFKTKDPLNELKTIGIKKERQHFSEEEKKNFEFFFKDSCVINGIRKFHQFCYLKEGTILVKKVSNYSKTFNSNEEKIYMLQ